MTRLATAVTKLRRRNEAAAREAQANAEVLALGTAMGEALAALLTQEVTA